MRDRIKIVDIAREYGLNPDQMYAYALELGGYNVEGVNVDDATIPVIMMRHLAWDFKNANKKGDWREALVAESLYEFLNERRGDFLRGLVFASVLGLATLLGVPKERALKIDNKQEVIHLIKQAAEEGQIYKETNLIQIDLNGSIYTISKDGIIFPEKSKMDLNKKEIEELHNYLMTI